MGIQQETELTDTELSREGARIIRNLLMMSRNHDAEVIIKEIYPSKQVPTSYSYSNSTKRYRVLLIDKIKSKKRTSNNKGLKPIKQVEAEYEKLRKKQT